MIRSLLSFCLSLLKSGIQIRLENAFLTNQMEILSRTIPQAQINLIKQMANENPLWGAPRIHGELLKLGIDLSEATVLRYIPKKPRRTTGQQWKTFLRNHSAEIISLDFFTVPTITFRLL